MTLIILIIIGVYIVGSISNKKELTKNGIKNLKDLEDKKSKLEEEIKDLNNLYENNKREYNNFKEETKKVVIMEKSEEIEKEINELTNKKNTLTIEVKDLETHFQKINAQDLGLAPTSFEFEKSETYKEKLKNIRLQEADLLRKVKNKKGENISIYKDDLIRLLYNSFNTFCDYNLTRLTFKTYPTRKKQIETMFNKLNRISNQQIQIDEKALDYKFQELDASYAYYKLKEEEKEALRQQREEEAENKRAQKELEAKQAKLDKEIEALNIAKDKVNDKLLSAKDDEIEALKLELQKLETEISGLQDEKTDIDYRVENTGAGYVYIISNIGSFGEEVYKIGVTRRLDPYQRIQELSSASVPFKFDVHAMIFSYQAYQLETELHRYFDSKRLNKVNNRKEFFNIKLEDIKKVLNLHKELTFDFNPEFEAEEYWATLKMIESEESKKEIEN
ncbi:GIY-YIG nuclease family protein [Anaerococcus tetradius]|uniref:GIY-YIG nuclease family protein n=1 Tax=Anaerococcus tetradius TaxID=33036 RepID=UPI0023F26ABF|nr:GIY-YIG nuclease family protein [Anaerococcus tetradius]